MTRINLKTGKLIKPQQFKGGNPERQLQLYVEKNLRGFLKCHFLKNFYNIPGGEIDTLAITEDGVPCIIEYKHKQEDRILNQIVFYYDWLSQKSTKFEFERIVKENEATKDLNIDWSDIRLICIAETYSKWDISLIKHLDTAIECRTYVYHEDELDILEPIFNQSGKQKSHENKQATIKEMTLEDHRNKASESGKKLLDNFREKILELGNDITEGYTPEYIKYTVNTNFLEIHTKRKWLIITFKPNERKFLDPKKRAKDIASRKWSQTREMKIENEEDINYAVGLVKQAYDYQKELF